jgi:hypothetical protein
MGWAEYQRTFACFTHFFNLLKLVFVHLNLVVHGSEDSFHCLSHSSEYFVRVVRHDSINVCLGFGLYFVVYFVLRSVQMQSPPVIL